MKKAIFIDYLLFTVIIIIYMSFIEYLLHRFVMHYFETEWKGWHTIHHAAIKKDFTIDRTIKDYDKLDEGNENLCLGSHAAVVIFTFLILFNIAYPYVSNRAFSYVITGLISALMFTYGFLTWNSIHPYMHGECVKEKCKGIDYKTTDYIVKNVPFFDFLVRNHKAHHKHKGEEKGNYNITIPIFDFVMNTYNPYYND